MIKFDVKKLFETEAIDELAPAISTNVTFEIGKDYLSRETTGINNGRMNNVLAKASRIIAYDNIQTELQQATNDLANDRIDTEDFCEVLFKTIKPLYDEDSSIIFDLASYFFNLVAIHENKARFELMQIINDKNEDTESMPSNVEDDSDAECSEDAISSDEDDEEILSSSITDHVTQEDFFSDDSIPMSSEIKPAKIDTFGTTIDETLNP